MALPKSPGKSYIDMYSLITYKRIHLLEDVFTDELIVGICWEETYFNNIKQDKGTAMGFGQVEPSDFWSLKTEDAQRNGYFVPDLPEARKLGPGIIVSERPLTDEQSVQVVSATLCHRFFALSAHPQAVLESYAGLPFSRKLAKQVKDKLITPEDAKKIDPLGPEERLQKIKGWQACEKILLDLPNGGDPRPQIRAALKAARTYPDGEAWDKILFPGPIEFIQGDPIVIMGPRNP
jgi:hypothetical protein